MEKLRLPLFITALVLLVLAFFLEIGSDSLAQLLAPLFDSQALDQASRAGLAPGLAIRYMALFDGLLLYTVVLMTLPLVISHAVHGRIHGIITLVVSITAIILSIVLALAAMGKLVLMVGLLFSPIFGTVAYFSIYAAFPADTALGILSAILFFKLGFAAFLLFSHQRFISNISLVILTLVSLLLGIVVSFLMAVVPGFLVSITDAIAAIIVAAVALVWAVKYLAGSLVALSKAAG